MRSLLHKRILGEREGRRGRDRATDCWAIEDCALTEGLPLKGRPWSRHASVHSSSYYYLGYSVQAIMGHSLQVLGTVCGPANYDRTAATGREA